MSSSHHVKLGYLGLLPFLLLTGGYFLTEAGWSAVAFDYAKKNNENFVWVMLYFVMCHIIVVIVLASVLKGIIWFVFITVSDLSY